MLQWAKRAKGNGNGNGNCNCQSLQANNVAQGQLDTPLSPPPPQRARPSCYWQSKRVLCAKGRTKGVGGGVGCMWTNGKNAIKRTPRKLCVGVARQVQLQLQVAGRVPKEAAHSAGKNVSVTLKTKDKAWQRYTTHTMRRVATLLRAPRTKLCKSK